MEIAQELEATRRRLRNYLESSPCWRNPLSPQHLHEAVFSYLQAGGKYLRPCLLLWSCRALGGEEDNALPIALAVEIFHTWTLVHDDIIDRDEVRRGRPTVHEDLRLQAVSEFGAAEFAAHYGQSLAMLAGDVQHGWAVSLAAETADHGADASLVLSLIRELEGEVLRELVEGEALDLQLSQRPLSEVTEEEILRMLAGKTAALFAFAARAGANLAKGQYSPDDAQVKALGEFGRHAGMVFQLQDDILGIIGREEELGKPVGSDIREGKRTLPLIYSWRNAPREERRRLEQIANKPDAGEAEISEACNLMQSLGGIAQAAEVAQQHLTQALHSLGAIQPGPARKLLADLVLFMIQRRH
jgi:geranylgeranyl diphosphate synthase type I